MNQQHSIFMPGLANRGPVYNAMDGLPTLSSGVKFALVAGLLAAGVMKKIPLVYAGAGAFALWTLFPDAASAAPITNPTPPTVSTMPVGDIFNPMPNFPSFQVY
ncbi:MAG: hypothetical protein ACRETL_06960 [Gammaproteobacteria bacterium]